MRDGRKGGKEPNGDGATIFAEKSAQRIRVEGAFAIHCKAPSSITRLIEQQ